jgi:hypothetical protein
MEQTKERAIITDKLVVEKTGKTMEAWFKILDRKAAKQMKHAEIFDLVSNIEALKTLGQWNQNLLTTTYEWSRNLKERGQKEDGFEISVSKTISVMINILYNSWIDDKQRNKWLKEKITIRKATANKSARITWSDNETSLSIDFYPKGENKSQVVVQHLKIPDAKTAAILKIFWGTKLDALKTFLEK